MGVEDHPIDEETLICSHEGAVCPAGFGHRWDNAGGRSDERGVLMSTIRVVIVDDHAMVAESLTRLLESEDDIEVVALAVTVAGAIEAARTCSARRRGHGLQPSRRRRCVGHRPDPRGAGRA